MQKSILIIAAGYLQTFLIKKAKLLDYYVIAIDGNPNAEGFEFADESACVNITDPLACVDFAKTKKLDGVVTVASDYGVIAASMVAAELNLPGISPETAHLIKNKYRVRRTLFESHVDDTSQCFEVSDSTDFNKLSSQVIFPVMVKPCDGSGSRGAGRVDEIKDLKNACDYAISNSLSGKAVIEPFIDGAEYGVESFVFDDEIHVMGIMSKQMTSPPYYAELGHSIPSGLDVKLEQKIRDVVTRAIQVLGITFGSVNMDLLITNDGGVHIVDIGARMGGNLIGSHIIPAASGIDYMANILRAAVNDPVDFSKYDKENVSTRLLALTPGKIRELPDFKKIEEEYGVKIEHHLRIGDVITPYRTNLDGCGYVVASGKSKYDNERLVAEVLSLIDNLIERTDE